MAWLFVFTKPQCEDRCTVNGHSCSGAIRQSNPEESMHLCKQTSVSSLQRDSRMVWNGIYLSLIGKPLQTGCNGEKQELDCCVCGKHFNMGPFPWGTRCPILRMEVGIQVVPGAASLGCDQRFWHAVGAVVQWLKSEANHSYILFNQHQQVRSVH